MAASARCRRAASAVGSAASTTSESRSCPVAHPRASRGQAGGAERVECLLDLGRRTSRGGSERPGRAARPSSASRPHDLLLEGRARGDRREEGLSKSQPARGHGHGRSRRRSPVARCRRHRGAARPLEPRPVSTCITSNGVAPADPQIGSARTGPPPRRRRPPGAGRARPGAGRGRARPGGASRRRPSPPRGRAATTHQCRAPVEGGRQGAGARLVGPLQVVEHEHRAVEGGRTATRPAATRAPGARVGSAPAPPRAGARRRPRHGSRSGRWSGRPGVRAAAGPRRARSRLHGSSRSGSVARAGHRVSSSGSRRATSSRKRDFPSRHGAGTSTRRPEPSAPGTAVSARAASGEPGRRRSGPAPPAQVVQCRSGSPGAARTGGGDPRPAPRRGVPQPVVGGEGRPRSGPAACAVISAMHAASSSGSSRTAGARRSRPPASAVRVEGQGRPSNRAARCRVDQCCRTPSAHGRRRPPAGGCPTTPGRRGSRPAPRPARPLACSCQARRTPDSNSAASTAHRWSSR